MKPEYLGGLAMLQMAFLLGCQTAPVNHAPIPVACQAGAFSSAARLPLPPAHSEPDSSANKSAPLIFANRIPVNGGVGDIGRWTDATPGLAGWKAWRLRLSSSGAKSLSVHLQPMTLPPRAELWLCAPDGTARQGPVRDTGPSGNGRFWSPAVSGSELWLEVLAPADRIHEVKLKINQVFAGFR